LYNQEVSLDGDSHVHPVPNGVGHVRFWVKMLPMMYPCAFGGFEDVARQRIAAEGLIDDAFCGGIFRVDCECHESVPLAMSSVHAVCGSLLSSPK